MSGSRYDKREDFPFAIHNYPHIDSNLLYLYISQLIRFAKAYDMYPDFLTRHQRLVSTLMLQGFKYDLLCRKFKQFYRSHFDLISSRTSLSPPSSPEASSLHLYCTMISYFLSPLFFTCEGSFFLTILSYEKKKKTRKNDYTAESNAPLREPAPSADDKPSIPKRFCADKVNHRRGFLPAAR